MEMSLTIWVLFSSMFVLALGFAAACPTPQSIGARARKQDSQRLTLSHN